MRRNRQPTHKGVKATPNSRLNAGGKPRRITLLHCSTNRERDQLTAAANTTGSTVQGVVLQKFFLRPVAVIFVTTYRAPCGPRPTCGCGPTADPRRY
jgi:hypothetical protein